MLFPVVGDQYYGVTDLLLPMTGANNGTTFEDASSPPTTVTRYNAITSTAQSKWGNGSGYFDGTGDYLTTPTLLSASGDFCIEGWFYVTSATDVTLYSQKSASVNSGGLVVVWSATGIVNAYIDAVPSVDLYTICAGSDQWFHYALTRNGNVFNAYANGIVGLPVTRSVAIEQSLFYIGRNPATESYYFNGYMQDFRVTAHYRYSSIFPAPNSPLPARGPEPSVHRKVVQQHSHRFVTRLGL